MSRTTRPGTSIVDFQPDDTDTKFYLDCSYQWWTLQEILNKAKEKWPEASLENISIGAENIHTHCLHYDRHDPDDWTDFIIVELDR